VLPQTSSTNFGDQTVGRHGGDTGGDTQELGSQFLEIRCLCFYVQDFHSKLRSESSSCGEAHAWYDPETLDWWGSALDTKRILLLIYQDSGAKRFPATALKTKAGKICNKIPEHIFIISLNTDNSRTINVFYVDSVEVTWSWKFFQFSLNTPPTLGLRILSRIGINHPTQRIL
jgi:hypothetical protein